MKKQSEKRQIEIAEERLRDLKYFLKIWRKEAAELDKRIAQVKTLRDHTIPNGEKELIRAEQTLLKLKGVEGKKTEKQKKLEKLRLLEDQAKRIQKEMSKLD